MAAITYTYKEAIERIEAMRQFPHIARTVLNSSYAWETGHAIGRAFIAHHSITPFMTMLEDYQQINDSLFDIGYEIHYGWGKEVGKWIAVQATAYYQS